MCVPRGTARLRLLVFGFRVKKDREDPLVVHVLGSLDSSNKDNNNQQQIPRADSHSCWASGVGGCYQVAVLGCVQKRITLPGLV